MDFLSVSVQEWKDLYHAAIEFKNMNCWDWMYDTDIFGVQNPEDGEIGYCCVLGNAAEFYGLSVYSGTRGLHGYLRMQSDEFLNNNLGALYAQECLMASFMDRNELAKEDLQMIKQLGLKFRGRNTYPIFRSYLPGYYPWFLHKKEAIYLVYALQQAKLICERCKNNKKILESQGKDHYLVRVPNIMQETMNWEDRYLEPAPLKIIEERKEEWDENRI